MLGFVRAGLASAEPVFIALPGGLGWRVRAAAGAAARQLAVADMNGLGRNPARITLALGSFAASTPGSGSASSPNRCGGGARTPRRLR